MIRPALILLAAAMPTAARAQAPSAAASAYCIAASAGFLSSDAQGFAELAKCTKGDTVIIPGASASVVARVCDFTRSMVAIGGNVICSIHATTERPRR